MMLRKLFKRRSACFSFLSLLLAFMLALTSVSALAQSSPPPAPPEGGMMGTPPDMPEGGMGTPPDRPGGPMGMDGPGGGSGKPDQYDAVMTLTEDADVTSEVISSTGADENALLVSSGHVSVTESVISRTSDSSTGGDSASFYGVGAAVLTTGGTVSIENSEITTDAAGGAGVFAYGDGVAYVSDTIISTTQNTSGGIHVAGGGTLYARDLTVTTKGGSAAAIRSDRGSGTMVMDGGSYTSSGSGSPAVYVTADITIHSAALTAEGSEALCLEGLNSVRLYDCDLTGMMPDQAQNDNT